MSAHIRKTKTKFAFSSLLLIGLIVFGVTFFQKFSFAESTNSLKYLGYRYEYSKELTPKFGDRLGMTWNGVPDTRLASKLHDASIPVFVYHGIVKEADRFSMTQKTFKEQMFALKRAGYETITTQQLSDFMHNGTPLPVKSFLLTFDDGRRDSFYGADPVLHALDYTAVMYFAVESSMPASGLMPTYYLNEDEIRTMTETGRWEIGSHAVQETGGFVRISETGEAGNFLSNYKWIADEQRLESPIEYRERIEREIVDSRRILEETFGVPVKTFSYPFGDYGQQTGNNPDAVNVISELISETYELAFRQTWDANNEFTLNYPNGNPYHTKRIETPTDWDGDDLIAFLNTHDDRSIPFEDSFTTDTGWRNSWGFAEIKDGQLVLQASKRTSGAAAFFPGSKTWNNYLFSAEVAHTEGTHISLMAQYVNANDYTVCTFGSGRVKIEHFLNDVPTLLTEQRSTLSYARPYTFSIRAADGTIECFVNNVHIASAPAEMKEGGVGVRIWSEGVGTANMHVDAVSVVSVP